MGGGVCAAALPAAPPDPPINPPPRISTPPLGKFSSRAHTGERCGERDQPAASAPLRGAERRGGEGGCAGRRTGSSSSQDPKSFGLSRLEPAGICPRHARCTACAGTGRRRGDAGRGAGVPRTPRTPPSRCRPGAEELRRPSLLRGASPCQVTPVQPPLRGAAVPPHKLHLCIPLGGAPPCKHQLCLHLQGAPMHPPESLICVSSSCKVHLCIPLPGGTLTPPHSELYPCIPLGGAHAPVRCTHAPPYKLHPCIPPGGAPIHQRVQLCCWHPAGFAAPGAHGVRFGPQEDRVTESASN